MEITKKIKVVTPQEFSTVSNEEDFEMVKYIVEVINSNLMNGIFGYINKYNHLWVCIHLSNINGIGRYPIEIEVLVLYREAGWQAFMENRSIYLRPIGYGFVDMHKKKNKISQMIQSLINLFIHPTHADEIFPDHRII